MRLELRNVRNSALFTYKLCSFQCSSIFFKRAVLIISLNIEVSLIPPTLLILFVVNLLWNTVSVFSYFTCFVRAARDFLFNTWINLGIRVSNKASSNEYILYNFCVFLGGGIGACLGARSGICLGAGSGICLGAEIQSIFFSSLFIISALFILW